MPPSAVVPDLDVPEDRAPGILAGVPTVLHQQLELEGGEKRPVAFATGFVGILLTQCDACTALPGCCPPYPSRPLLWSQADSLASLRLVRTRWPACLWRMLPTRHRPLRALVRQLEKHLRVIPLLVGCRRPPAHVSQWSHVPRLRSHLLASGSLRHRAQCFA